MAAAVQPSKPLDGLSLAGFREIIDLLGGRAALEGKTTSNVKVAVLEITLAAVSTAVALLRPGHVSRATVFLSHEYGGVFLDAVDAAEAWEKRQLPEQPQFFYYFDLFVVNQHGQGAVVPFEVLRDTFCVPRL